MFRHKVCYAINSSICEEFLKSHGAQPANVEQLMVETCIYVSSIFLVPAQRQFVITKGSG